MEMRYDQLSPVPPLTRITKILIVTCVVTFFVDYALGYIPGMPDLKMYFGLVPGDVLHRYFLWQFVTYIFMHGGHLHLLLNMLILWYFGAEIEMRMGESAFLLYFFLCGIGAGVFIFAVSILTGGNTLSPIVGASGAIFGILAAYGIFFGERYFLVFFLFPMKAKYFVILIGLIELFTGLDKARVQDNVAHFAHIGGMFVGAAYIYFRYMRPRQKGGMSKKDADREKLKRQFTLIVNQPPKEEEKKDGPFWN